MQIYKIKKKNKCFFCKKKMISDEFHLDQCTEAKKNTGKNLNLKINKKSEEFILNDEKSFEIKNKVLEANLKLETNHKKNSLFYFNDKTFSKLRKVENNLIRNEENNIIKNEENNMIRNEENNIIRNEENNLIRYEENNIIKNKENNLIRNEENNIIRNEENNLIRNEENNLIKLEHLFRNINPDNQSFKINSTKEKEMKKNESNNNQVCCEKCTEPLYKTTINSHSCNYVMCKFCEEYYPLEFLFDHEENCESENINDQLLSTQNQTPNDGFYPYEESNYNNNEQIFYNEDYDLTYSQGLENNINRTNNFISDNKNFHEEIEPKKKIYGSLMNSINEIKFNTKLNDKKCSICFNYFKINENVKLLQCIHVFHIDCINDWINKSKNCPVCKFEITK